MQIVRMVTLRFIIFELFSLELCASQKLCPLYNLKKLKLYSRNFIQILISMSRRAERKNSNSVIYTLLVNSLGTLSITKTLIYDYFIPGYDCAIVN